MADKTLAFTRKKWPDLDIVAAVPLEQHPRWLRPLTFGVGVVAGVATLSLRDGGLGGGVAGAVSTILFMLGTPRSVMFRTAAGSLLIAPTRVSEHPPRPVTQAGWLRKGFFWDRWNVDGDVFKGWRGHVRQIDALLSEADDALTR